MGAISSFNSGAATSNRRLGRLNPSTATGAFVENMFGVPVGAVAGGTLGALAALVKLLRKMTTLTPAGGALMRRSSSIYQEIEQSEGDRATTGQMYLRP